MESAKRIEKWDILKFVLIFLVVLGHTIEVLAKDASWINPVEIFIYTFHMPLFVFVSGLFSKRTVNEKRYDKILVFLFLFFISEIILFMSRTIAYKKAAISFFIVNGLPWYMLALFVFMLITIAVKRCSPVYVLLLSVAVACVAGYDPDIGDRFAALRIFTFYPFFYLGYCLEPDKIVKITDRKIVRLISAIVLIAFIYLVFTKTEFFMQFKPLLSGRRSFSDLGRFQNYGFALRFIYYIFVFVIGFAVISVIPKKLSRFGIISGMGSRSLQVYLLHYSFLHIIDGRLKGFLPDINIAITVAVIAVSLTVLCSLKIWEPVFKLLMNPFRKKAK